MKSLKGQIPGRVAAHGRPNFSQTVVLLVQHNEDGAFGVVLNRPADSTLKDLWEKVTQEPCEIEQHVHVGGPVAGPLMALHADRSLAEPEQEVVPGVYFAVERALGETRPPTAAAVADLHQGTPAGVADNWKTS